MDHVTRSALGALCDNGRNDDPFGQRDGRYADPRAHGRAPLRDAQTMDGLYGLPGENA